jgi:hypothetical protein
VRQRFWIWIACGALGALVPVAGAQAQSQAPHPCLLFVGDDACALRVKLLDGGDDDRAWNAIVETWPEYEAALPESLAATMGGINAATELGLLAHLGDLGPAPADKARALGLDLARRHDVDQDDFDSSLRLRAMALGYDLAYAAFGAAERAEIRAEIRAYLAYMPTHFNYSRYMDNPFTSNRGATVGAAMGLAVIAIWPESSAEERVALAPALEFGHRLVLKCLGDNLAGDGAYREGVLYASWTMRMAIPYLEARRRFDGVDATTDPRLERMAEWLAYEVLPEGGGRTNNVNDSPLFSRPLAVHSTYLDWAQTRFASPLACWLYRHVAGDFGWDGGAAADRAATVLWSRPGPDVDPATVLPASRLFAERGMYAYRSGWKSGATGGEILFSLYAGRFLGGHAQEDQGQFTLYAFGDRYVVDNGAVHPTQLPKDSQAHNIVVADGRGQHNAGQSIGTDARIAASLLAPLCDWVRADLDSAYDTHSPLNDPDIPYPGTDWSWGYDGGNPMQRAQRTIAVIHGPDAPTWMLVADDFRKDAAPHRWQWLLHTDSTNVVDLASDPIAIHAAHGRLCLWFARPRPPALAVVAEAFENGGEDPNTTRLAAEVHAVEPGYVVALMPLESGTPAPAVTSEPLGRATQLRLAWGGVEDVAIVNPTDSLVTGALQTDGRLALTRNAGTDVIGYALAEGRSLRQHASRIVTLDRVGSVTMSGSTLHVDRHDLGFTVWAPHVSRVVGPNGDVPFRRSGDWVRDIARLVALPGGRVADSVKGPAIHLDCSVDPGADVRVAIHDVRGRLVRVLGPGLLAPSRRSVGWDGLDAGGRHVAAGVYFARVHACGRDTSRRITVVR